MAARTKEQGGCEVSRALMNMLTSAKESTGGSIIDPRIAILETQSQQHEAWLERLSEGQENLTRAVAEQGRQHTEALSRTERTIINQIVGSEQRRQITPGLVWTGLSVLLAFCGVWALVISGILEPIRLGVKENNIDIVRHEQTFNEHLNLARKFRENKIAEDAKRDVHIEMIERLLIDHRENEAIADAKQDNAISDMQKWEREVLQRHAVPVSPRAPR